MAEKSRRGFAAMDREKQRQIASKGGKAAHAKGSAHEFTSDQARDAGRKGGRAAHARGTAHKFTSQEAQEAGRKGGLNSHRAAAARRSSGDEPDSDQPIETGAGNHSATPPGQPMPERASENLAEQRAANT
jgi:general stress protein YciG